ncbi:MAG: hypothetical protein AB7F50_05175 [Fimbriimonadaceae bacterium]
MRPGLVALTALIACGCAKFPDTGGVGATTRLVFTMEVDRQIRSGRNTGENGLPYVYVVAIFLSKVDNPPEDGPLPVVSPGGNGIVAGQCSHFVMFYPPQGPDYQIWEFRDATLNERFPKGIPIQTTDVNPGSARIQFEIDLSQLVPLADVGAYRSAKVNFLTMNNTNTQGGGRVWDARGQFPVQVNRPFTVPLRASRTFRNAQTDAVEGAGDCADPDLDIVDWTIEVRKL